MVSDPLEPMRRAASNISGPAGDLADMFVAATEARLYKPDCVWGDCPDDADFVCEGGFGSGRSYLLCGRHATMFTTPRPGSSKEPLTKDTP